VTASSAISVRGNINPQDRVTTRADDNSDDTTAVRAPDYMDTNYLFPQVKAYDPELLISGSAPTPTKTYTW